MELYYHTFGTRNNENVKNFTFCTADQPSNQWGRSVVSLLVNPWGGGRGVDKMVAEDGCVNFMFLSIFPIILLSLSCLVYILSSTDCLHILFLHICQRTLPASIVMYKH